MPFVQKLLNLNPLRRRRVQVVPEPQPATPKAEAEAPATTTTKAEAEAPATPKAEAKPAKAETSKEEDAEEQLVPIELADDFSLSNPDDVFDCCDTNWSGFLDPDEVQFALKAFGFYPKKQTLVELLGEKSKLDQKEFRDLLDECRSRGVENEDVLGQKGRHAVPFARRGLHLGELEALQKAFIKTDWLANICEEGNKDTSRRFQLQENLYAFDEFIVRPSTTPGTDRPPSHLRDMAGMPSPNDFSSYSELMHKNGIKVDYFVSHFWGHLFADTIASLQLWAASKYQDVGKQRPREVAFWICLFAVNQHAAADEVGSSPDEGPFNAALQKATGGAIMIIDEQLVPFTRIWCLFEVDRLSGSGRPFELVSSEGPLRGLVETSFKETIDQEVRERARDYVTCIASKLQDVSAYGANASNDNDRVAIWHRIADPTISQLPQATLKAWIADDDDSVGCVDFSEFDSRVGGLLAGPLFEMYLKNKDLESSLKYIGLGAHFGMEEINQLKALGCDVATTTVCMRTAGDDWRDNTTLLHAAAWFGHVDAIPILLDHKADIEAEDDIEWRPLHYATKLGRCETVLALLGARADLEATDNVGDAVLHFAALNGRKKVAEILLQHGAEINKGGDDGWKPIHLAAYGGFTDLVDLLCEYKADIGAKDGDTEWTPLHYAAQNGVTKVVSRLLKLRADVNAGGNMGRIPIHLAAGNGHMEVIKMLHEAKSELNRNDCDNETPLYYAAGKERAQVIQFLLDNKADVGMRTTNGRTPLHSLAAMPLTDKLQSGSDSGKVETGEILLKAGVELDSSDDDGLRPTHLAAASGAQMFLKFLLSSRADLHATTTQGWSLLHAAASGTGFDYKDQCRDSSADEDEEEDEDEEGKGDEEGDEEEGNGQEDEDEEGEEGEDEEEDGDQEDDEEDEEEEAAGPYATEERRCEVLNFLVSSRVDVDAVTSTGATALHFAVGTSQSSVVAALLKARVCVNSQKKDGDTPLHVAAGMQESTAMIEKLVEGGAKPEIRNGQDERPSDIASKHGFADAEQSLLIEETLSEGAGML